jgi:hypothetical protein
MPARKVVVDETRVEELAAKLLSIDEIARLVGCSPKTLERRYQDALQRGRDNARLNLRAAQFRAAMDGNVAMLIWLGKQYLGQREPREPVAGEYPRGAVPKIEVVYRDGVGGVLEPPAAETPEATEPGAHDTAD